MNREDDVIEIDLMAVLNVLKAKIKAIVAITLVCGLLALGITGIFITPTYKAETLLYVNNSSFSIGSTDVSISEGDIQAAQSLVDTYIVILQTRLTLEEVIEEANLSYDYKELKKMIKASAVNGTEIFSVDVYSDDPKEAEIIANVIGRVLPKKISSIVDGSSVRIVDYAVVPHEKDSPSLMKNTLMGIFIGLIISCGLIIIRSLMEREVKEPDYVVKMYNLPLLAVIPDLKNPGKSDYQYYGKTRNK